MTKKKRPPTDLNASLKRQKAHIKSVAKSKKPKKVTKKMGRPTSFKPEYCKDLIIHMSKGLSFETFAATIGTHRGTLYDWCDTQPDFSYAKRTGQEMSQLFWEEVGIDQSVSGQGSSNALKFFMKNKFNWTDRQEMYTRIEVEKVFEAKTDQELLDVIEAKGIIISEEDSDD